MIGLKILFADNVFEKLKAEAERRKISVTNTAYTLIREKLGADQEKETD